MACIGVRAAAPMQRTSVVQPSVVHILDRTMPNMDASPTSKVTNQSHGIAGKAQQQRKRAAPGILRRRQATVALHWRPQAARGASRTLSRSSTRAAPTVRSSRVLWSHMIWQEIVSIHARALEWGSSATRPRRAGSRAFTTQPLDRTPARSMARSVVCHCKIWSMRGISPSFRCMRVAAPH